MIDKVIENVVNTAKATEYTIETLTIKTPIQIAEDEVVIVYACAQLAYSYSSADEYYSDSEELACRITTNRAFIDIESGAPQLQAFRIRFTKYADENTQEKKCSCTAVAVAVVNN